MTNHTAEDSTGTGSDRRLSVNISNSTVNFYMLRPKEALIPSINVERGEGATEGSALQAETLNTSGTANIVIRPQSEGQQQTRGLDLLFTPPPTAMMEMATKNNIKTETVEGLINGYSSSGCEKSGSGADSTTSLSSSSNMSFASMTTAKMENNEIQSHNSDDLLIASGRHQDGNNMQLQESIHLNGKDVGDQSTMPHKITFAGTLPGRPSRGRGGAAPPSILRSFPPRENDYAGSITTEEVNNTNNAQVSITNGHSQTDMGTNRNAFRGAAAAGMGLGGRRPDFIAPPYMLAKQIKEMRTTNQTVGN